jgi:hypothetical protein
MAVFLLATSSISAQEEDLEGTLAQLSEAAAKGYIGPIISAFGSNMNGGWFRMAPPPAKFGLDLQFGLVGMGTFFPDDLDIQTFSTSGSFRFTQSQAQEIVTNTSGLVFGGPLDEAELVSVISQSDFTVDMAGTTIVGPADGTLDITFNGGTITYTPPSTGIPEQVTVDPHQITLNIGGLGDYLPDASFLPYAAPQLSVGTIMGTRAVFRYVPEISVTEDIGRFSWFGWGIQHNPGVFFPTPLPVDVSICFAQQTIKLGDILEADTTAYGLNVSKKLGVGPISITPYAGYLIEKSKFHFTYDFTLDEGMPWEQNIPLDFTMEGENQSRITVGVCLKLLMFNINADYNIGNYNSVTVGILIGI